MSTEENKATSRRFYEELFNRGNLDAADGRVYRVLVPGTPPPPARVLIACHAEKENQTKGER